MTQPPQRFCSLPDPIQMPQVTTRLGSRTTGRRRGVETTGLRLYRSGLKPDEDTVHDM